MQYASPGGTTARQPRQRVGVRLATVTRTAAAAATQIAADEGPRPGRRGLDRRPGVKHRIGGLRHRRVEAIPLAVVGRARLGVAHDLPHHVDHLHLLGGAPGFVQVGMERAGQAPAGSQDLIDRGAGGDAKETVDVSLGGVGQKARGHESAAHLSESCRAVPARNSARTVAPASGPRPAFVLRFHGNVSI